MFQKMRPFFDKRFFPVAILWCGVLLIYNLVSSGIGYLMDKGSPTTLNLMSMTSFGDWRVVAILAVGTMAVMGLLSIVQLNINTNSLDRVRIDQFIKRLWDEASSAATHAGAATVASMYCGYPSVGLTLAKQQVATAIALFMIAFLAFHHESKDAEILALDVDDGGRQEKDAV